MDIHNKEFRKAVRGYDAEEVDEFLDEIIVDFEKMQRELDSLRNQLSTYSENMSTYKERENALNNALITAQQFADNVCHEAEEKAHKIVEDAEERAREIIGSSESALKTMSANYEALSLKHNELKDNMRRYLQNQLQSLDSDDIIIEPLGSLVSKDVSTMVKHVVNEVKNDDDNEETKINAKLKELMDAKIYDKGDQNDYRY